MESKKKKKNNFIEQAACFDLHFRRDVRKKRVGSPVYYSWKARFTIATSTDKENLLQKIKENLNCGQISFSGSQLNYSVQKVDDLINKVIPFFENHHLKNKKKINFELWSEAVRIIHKNKGKLLFLWAKEDFQNLINIQKKMLKYKTKKINSLKWLPVAESLIETLAEDR
jgi:hypothetical protein